MCSRIGIAKKIRVRNFPASAAFWQVAALYTLFCEPEFATLPWPVALSLGGMVNESSQFWLKAEDDGRKIPFSPCDLRKPVVVLTWKIRGTLLFLSTLELLNIQTRQNWELGAPVIYFFSEPHRPWKKLNLSCFKSGQKIRSDLFFFAPELLTLNIASTHLIGGAIRL